MATKNKDQARLRLVKSDDLDICSSFSFTAAKPLGSDVRPVPISLTDDGASPISSPISTSVIPMDRRSRMRDAHVNGVFIRPTLRHAVDLSQRLPVTEFRENSDMPKPPGMPDQKSSLGERVRFWRKVRKMSRATLAKKVGYSSISGLSDLELGYSQASEKLHLIAAELGLNGPYLQTGRGEPESGYPQEAPPDTEEWPFPAISPAKLKKFNKIERSYLETCLVKGINDIEAERRNKSS